MNVVTTDDMSAAEFKSNVADFITEQQRRRGGESPEVRGLAFTDLGNGRRFAKQHGANVRYVEDLGKQKWLVWTEETEESRQTADSRPQEENQDPNAKLQIAPAEDAGKMPALPGWGGFWSMDRTGEVMRLAKRTCETIRDESQPADAPATFIEDRGKHYVRTQERKGLMSMLALAQSEPPIPSTPEEFDKDPLLLNCLNGTLALHDGNVVFRPARREEMLTKRIPVRYDPEAKAPLWESMVARWMGHKEASEIKDDAEREKATIAVNSLTSFLARAVGLSATGVINDRAVFILHGTGANGKTIFIETVRSLMGADFSTVMPVEALLAGKPTSSIPTDIADLRGKRLALASETNENDRLSLAKLKRLSGGDMLTGRQLYGQKFDFSPTHHLWLATNHKPNMRGATKAVFDRIKLVSFKVRIPESEQTPSEQLKAALRAELPGILNWALAGFVDWWKSGLAAPVEVTSETTRWETDDDLLRHFIDEVMVSKKGARVAKGVAYAAWVSYCKDRNEYHGSNTQFSRWMKERDIDEGRNGRERWWENIELAPAFAGGLPRVIEENLKKSRETPDGELQF